MEVKINREIRDYHESVFFGLNLRQLVFAILAIAAAVGIYFGLRDILGTETVSWLCILGAVPFGAIGFVKYNGMNAEQFIAAFIKSELLMPRVLTFKAENIYYEVIAARPTIAEEKARQTKRKKSRKPKEGDAHA